MVIYVTEKYFIADSASTFSPNLLSQYINATGFLTQIISKQQQHQNWIQSSGYSGGSSSAAGCEGGIADPSEQAHEQTVAREGPGSNKVALEDVNFCGPIDRKIGCPADCGEVKESTTGVNN